MDIGIFTTQMRQEFLKGQQLQPEQVTDYKPWVFEVPSSARFEVYPGINAIPRLKRYTGHREYSNADYTRLVVENLEFSSGLRVPLRDINDGNVPLWSMLFSAMGQDATYAFPPRFLVQTLAAGESKPSWGETNFFASTHSLGGGNSSLPANFTGGLNLLNYTSQGTSDGNTFKACFLMTGSSIKPMMYQMRQPSKLMTNSGESSSFEAKEVRYWADCEVAGAFTQWWLALMVNITNTPTIPDCYTIIDTAINQLRTFTLPQASPVDPLVYANGSFVPSPKAATLIVSSGCGQVFWHTLSEERIGVNVAGSNSGFTNNIYRGTFNLVIDPYMV